MHGANLETFPVAEIGIPLRTVAVLFAMPRSIYHSVPGCDVWDKERNALQWPGGSPVVAHPPCRAWAGLRMFAKPEPGERELAIWAVEQVRKYGGVLEHPDKSLLWPECGLPAPWPAGGFDAFGGWTLRAPQFWWGHRALKITRFYIVGIRPASIPRIPLRMGEAPRTLGLYSGRNKRDCRKSITKREQSATPPALAQWLVDLARKTQKS